MRRLSGFFLGWVVRAWLVTLRVRVEAWPDGTGPWVLAFWHGNQMGLLAARRMAPLSVLVSLSRDGELQSGVLGALGLLVVRGSSSRGASGGLRGLLRSVRAGRSLAFAVDGPRGPVGVAKPGAAFAARAAGAPLLPVAAASSSALVLRRAWDGFEIPLPFSRIVIVAGHEIPADAALRDPGLVSRGIERARARARDLARYGGADAPRLPGRAPERT